MKKLKSIFKKHWNCLPWFICGIAVMVDGEVTLGQFFLAWVVTLWLAWMRPVRNKIEEEN